MGKTVHKDLVIRGVTYADAAAAAEALGVTRGAVYHAINRGVLQKLGLGRAGIEPMQIRIRDKVYADASEAAKAFGVSKSAIYNALHRGSLDRMGLPPPYMHPVSKEFRIGDLRFPSLRSASLALGFGPAYISRALRSGRASSRQRILAAAMRVSAERQAQESV